MLYKTGFENILKDVKFHDWTVRVRYDAVGVDQSEYPTTRCYLQVHGISDDARPDHKGGRYVWRGRKWFLSPHMAKSEVVSTAFMAILAAVEHETREFFKYKGQAIYGPHIHVDVLADLMKQPGVIDVRVEKGGENHG